MTEVVVLENVRGPALDALAAEFATAFPDGLDAVSDPAGVRALIVRNQTQVDAALLERLPALDRLAAHALADEIAASDASFALATDLLRSWMWGSVRLTATGRGEPAAFSRLPGRLARWAEVWDKVEDSLRLADTFNLDRRHAVLSLFRALAEAAETSPSEPA